jgi:hypothetical protein
MSKPPAGLSSIPQAWLSPPSYGNLPPDVLDYALFLPGIWLACALGPCIKLIGPAFAVAPTGLCLLYAVLRRIVPPRLLSFYLGFCLFVAALSRYQLLPTSWQVYFLEDAIIRQLIPTFGFFAVAWASKAYFRRRILNGDVFWGAPIFLTLTIIVAPVVMLEQGLGYEGDYSAFAVFSLYGSFVNNVLIGLFFVFGSIFFAQDLRRYAALAWMLVIAITTHFVQFKLLAAVTVVTLVGVPGRKAVIGAIALLVGIYAVGINFVPEVMSEDPNDGLRLALVADTITSVADTYGVGIGYGKESVRWVYRFSNVPVFTFLPDPRTITHSRMLEALSTGVENSFAESLLRTGIVGFLLLVAATFTAFPPRNLARAGRNHAAVIFAMLFIGCFVNSSLETPTAVVGLGFAYGYLLALRGRSRIRTPLISWSRQSSRLRAMPSSPRTVPAPLESIRDDVLF